MTKITINGTDHETDLTQEQINTALGIKSSCVWKPEYNEKYYTPFVPGYPYLFTCYFAEGIYNCGLAFQTSEQAKKEYERLCAIKRVKDFCIENFGEFVPDWKNSNQAKCYIYYDYNCNKYDYGIMNTYKTQSLIHYLEKVEHAQQVIDNCEKDLKIIFGIE